jgi:hypothetical protein
MMKGTYLKVDEAIATTAAGVNGIRIRLGIPDYEDVPEELKNYLRPPVFVPGGSCQLIDIAEYTRGIQREVTKALYDIYCSMDCGARLRYFSENRIDAIIQKVPGDEIMEKYQEWLDDLAAEKAAEEAKKEAEKQKKIRDAVELLQENGYLVARPDVQ